MKTVEHYYGADLDWVASFANKLGGKVDGNFILLPEKINTGFRYVVDCGADVVALYIDVEYNTDIHFIQKNIKNDFVGFYYNLTEGEAKMSNDGFLYDVGCLGYNLSVLDSVFETNYYVKAGSKSLALCVFIKKNKIRSFFNKKGVLLEFMNKIMDPAQNTFIKFDRISNESYHHLNDLRKLKVGGTIFDLQLIGTAHLLVSDYLNQMLNDTIILEKVDESDLISIIEIQSFLSDRVEDSFPSINLIASKANMSDTKFKKLFKKITGTTPSAFFLAAKLRKAKELFEEKQSSIAQVSDKLNFTNYSYFTFRFKEYFGVSPSAFIKQL